MTVGELIKALSSFDENKDAVIEYNGVHDFDIKKVYDGKGEVYISFTKDDSLTLRRLGKM